MASLLKLGCILLTFATMIIQARKMTEEELNELKKVRFLNEKFDLTKNS